MKTITECIVLAGGLGTRLRSVVADVPKCMAPINDKPFLAYIIKYLQSQGIERFIFSLGYKHQVVTNYIGLHYPKLQAKFVIEDEPLGTGGAIKWSCEKATTENVIIANGDTMFKANLMELSAMHLQQKADCTLALKPMQNFERYGVVELDESRAIKSFKEKQFYKEGLINGGLYALNVTTFMNEALPPKFSFEKDYLESLYKHRKMLGLVVDNYFIDIGIPEDFARAQTELEEGDDN